MRENKLKQLWSQGRAVVNGWLAIPSAFAAEIMVHAGWDSVTVDMQHGLIDYQVMVSLLQAISTTDVVPLVRVPWNEPGIIMKSLDAGAYGIICPLINSREEAMRFVQTCRYPPEGFRSSGPVRAALYAGSDYHKHANRTIVTLAMIETKTALASLDEIMTTPGLDGVYIGPADLSFALTGNFGFDHEEGTVCYEAIMSILDAANRHGVIAGIHTGSAEYAAKMIQKGFKFVTIASDARLLAAAATDAVQKVRAAHGPAELRHESTKEGSAPY